MEFIESLQKLIPWAANLPIAPKLLVSLIMVALTTLVLLLIWTKPVSDEPITDSHSHSGSNEAVTEWVRTVKGAREIGTIHSDRPLPTQVASSRAAFEKWWSESGLSERKKIIAKTIYDALSLNSRLYRLQEIKSDTKPLTNYWADEAIHFFEETQDRELLVEALLDKGAILLELSQIKHTDPESFREIAKTGDSVMARASSLAEEHQKSEVFRFWSRMYYNLARPKSGNLTENWDNNYLLTSYQKMLKAYELKPDEINNATQLARVTQKTAANPPQDNDPKWTYLLRTSQKILLGKWNQFEINFPSPNKRVPPLNILGVITMDTVRREWKELSEDKQRESAKQFLSEIDDVALQSLRDAFVLISNTEWEKEYDFDLHYDLARIYSLKVQILQLAKPDRVEFEFSEVLNNMGLARNGGTSIQNDAAFQSINKDPNLAGLSEMQREKLEKLFQPNL